MVDQYEVHTQAPDGSEGELVAFVQQKRMAFKEKVTLYTDASKERVFAQFRARNVIDVGATYDVTDPSGGELGSLRKDFKRSLLRSTWYLEQPGAARAKGEESNAALAIVRRVWEFLPFLNAIPFAWPYHFTFRSQSAPQDGAAGKPAGAEGASDGAPAFSVTKKFALRDRYQVDIADPRLDRRLVIAQAVALDALQSR
ncbi:hypothetical protein H9Y04_05995 [Streptomyces sp. TRM66268-LWL]|uniref:Uncharacterized protein n=2 Tax=Streptomyces polyasparticus TaxID=2767826 RepID=A0ABR7SBI7_9ACTN|nr:hypothetical protein [Streptomyces polyasparticus]